MIRTTRAGAACAFAATILAAPMLRAESAVFSAELPAPNREASFLGSVSIDRVAGQDGDRLAFALERALGAPAIDGRPAFAILSARGGTEPDGLVSGQVTTGVVENRIEVTRERCIERDDKDKCVKRGNVKERCRRRVITVDADVRIARTEDDRVVYSASKPRRDEATWCRGDDDPRAAEPVIADMIEAIAAEVRDDITPHVRDFHIRFRESRKNMPKPIGERFKQAVEISMKRPAEACAAWQAIDAEMPDHPSVVFNLGLCAEASGDYETAMRHYERMRQLDPRAGDVRDALARVPQLIAGAAEAEERAATRS